jgi:hypothetical protein
MLYEAMRSPIAKRKKKLPNEKLIKPPVPLYKPQDNKIKNSDEEKNVSIGQVFQQNEVP